MNKTIIVAITLLLVSHVFVNATPVSNKTQLEQNIKDLKEIEYYQQEFELSIETLDNQCESNIVTYASNFLGTPYLFGGKSPSTGFDCSGFTQYVFAHFYINIGRTTYDQINDGYEVSKNELEAGDLVFFGTNNNPTHTGIYMGNNTYIHAPRTGDVIKISPMSRPDYITARRVKTSL